MKFYFATPDHTWERGSNENFGGLLQQNLPKGSCMRSVTQGQRDHIVDDLNNRPKKRLALRTPEELCNMALRGVALANRMYAPMPSKETGCSPSEMLLRKGKREDYDT